MLTVKAFIKILRYKQYLFVLTCMNYTWMNVEIYFFTERLPESPSALSTGMNGNKDRKTFPLYA